MSDRENDDQGQVSKHHSHTEILTSGTKTVSDQSADGKDFILAGTASSPPTLQFIGGLGTTHSYSPRSLLVANGNVDVGFSSTVEVTHGVQVFSGQLNVSETFGSVLTLDGVSAINGGASINDAGGLRPTGSEFILNGTLTLGSVGANHLNLGQVAGLGGNGIIRQSGQADVTDVGNVAAGVHFDIRKGELQIGSSFGEFDGTIGPTSDKGPALGPTADVIFFPAAFLVSQVQTAKFDTSAGVLSLLNSTGRDLVDFHFSGNASGLNVSTQPDPTAHPGIVGSYLTITDHPGSISPIPITFS